MLPDASAQQNRLNARVGCFGVDSLPMSAIGTNSPNLSRQETKARDLLEDSLDISRHAVPAS